MVTVSPDQRDAIESNADTLLAISNIVFSSFERLTNLNLHAARLLLEESAAASSLMLESNGSTASSKAKKAIPEAAMQNAVAYFQDIQELTTDTQQELTRVTTSYFAEQAKGTKPGVAWLKGFDVFNQLNATTEANRKMASGTISRAAGAPVSQSAKSA